ncbi:MAG: zinc ABC transporter substrate-binding protein [Rhodospirillales bacterium]
MHANPLILWLFLLIPLAAAQAAPVSVVAAENMYGDVAQAIAGDRAAVRSILSNPNTDPHFFEASPSVARSLAGAAIVVVNGEGYDPWMQTLLGASAHPGRDVLVVADLVHARPGGNPHLWYAPATMPAVARALAAALSRQDPAGAGIYAARLDAVLKHLHALDDRISALRTRVAGRTVTATEPVFGLMADALGLDMRNERFQLAVMNDTEPRASDVAAMEADLRGHKVGVLLYNAQVTDASTQRLLGIAQQAGVPVVGVTETLPPNTHYTGWMLDQLTAVATALHAGS